MKWIKCSEEVVEPERNEYIIKVNNYTTSNPRFEGNVVWIDVNPNWISVKDKTPSEDQRVFALGCSGVFIGEYNEKHDYWYSEKYSNSEYTEDYEPVTHWIPLPSLPEA